ncbi:hypothetical protein FQA39_LY16512 [Lamprigera yunnana]|nr:hypothetical protein FQA39_LY16512 [Lamprigera yunnana]
MPKIKPSLSRRRKRNNNGSNIIRNLRNKFINNSTFQTDLPELEIESDENPILSISDVIKGTIVDLAYVLNQHEYIANHKFICTMGKMRIQREVKQGMLYLIWDSRLAEEMKLAGEEETRIAIEQNRWFEINNEAIPHVTVIIDGGIQTAIKNCESNKQDAAQLRKTLLNAPFHVFGCHINCCKSFCKRQDENTDALDISQRNGVFSEVQKYLEPIVQKAHLLTSNQTTNQAER